MGILEDGALSISDRVVDNRDAVDLGNDLEFYNGRH